MPDFSNGFGTVEVTQPGDDTMTAGADDIIRGQSDESDEELMPRPQPNYGLVAVVAAVIGVGILTVYAISKVD